jgi:glycosyltransferase involved in cell wall biosynthesis
MATYNGAAFVEEQLTSILAELGPQDEVIVVDDCSTDDTVELVLALGDPRIRLEENASNLGYAATFESALTAASGDLLLLADQDDVWSPARVAAMTSALERGLVVAGNIALLGTGEALSGPFGRHPWQLPNDERRRFRILVALFTSNVPYFGSAMGLRRSALDLVLPFPASARELPDAWIAINGLLSRSIVHLEEVVVLRRIHEHNTSGRRRSWPHVIAGRLLFLRMVAVALRRQRALRRRNSSEYANRMSGSGSIR